MEFQELISGARDAVSVRRVYGDPYEKNGLTLIPAATVRGGGGGGVGDRQDDEPAAGRGGGFGLVARPSGAWIIEDGHATWKPAIDVNRIVMGGQVIALTAIIITGRILRTQSHRRHALRGLVSHLPDRRSVRLGRGGRQHMQRYRHKLVHHLS
jgi:uncharacterized spore protein YtfJ